MFGGVTVFVIGQVLVVLFLERIRTQARCVEEIAQALVLYAPFYSNKQEVDVRVYGRFVIGKGYVDEPEAPGQNGGHANVYPSANAYPDSLGHGLTFRSPNYLLRTTRDHWSGEPEENDQARM